MLTATKLKMTYFKLHCMLFGEDFEENKIQMMFNTLTCYLETPPPFPPPNTPFYGLNIDIHSDL